MRIKLDLTKINSRLHWTTLYSEKLLLAVIGLLTIFAACSDVYEMLINMKVELGDLFLLFIYAEIVGMVGAFYISCLLYTSPSPRDRSLSRMPSSA